jgi:hypothetical protein
MYSFAQRDDMQVVDEPLYGHYLRVSGADHPGRDEVMAKMNCAGDKVMFELLARAHQSDPKHLLLKHMAHHLVDIELGFLQQTKNVFLIRDPREMLPSLTVQLPQARLADTGLEQQWQLFANLVSSGQNPSVLDSRELLLDPAGVLQQLCKHLEIGFTDKMLHWLAGPRAEDGVWAPHWYHAVHQSTGFALYTAKTDFPSHLEPLRSECIPFYERLFEHAFRAGKETHDEPT